jgi:VIT1/CCC1 family predicted Fe2+/Mn2+ transporter
LLVALVTPTGFETATVSAASLAFLVVLGAVGARAGGARMMKAAIRVAFWGALAMAMTAGIGAIFGARI